MDRIRLFLLRVFNHPSKLSKGDKSGAVLTAAGAAALRLMSRSSKVVPHKSADQASITPGHREEAGTEVRPDWALKLWATSHKTLPPSPVTLLLVQNHTQTSEDSPRLIPGLDSVSSCLGLDLVVPCLDLFLDSLAMPWSWSCLCPDTLWCWPWLGLGLGGLDYNTLASKTTNHLWRIQIKGRKQAALNYLLLQCMKEIKTSLRAWYMLKIWQ